MKTRDRVEEFCLTPKVRQSGGVNLTFTRHRGILARNPTETMRTPFATYFLSALCLGAGSFLFPNFVRADALDNWTSRIIATNAGGGFRDVAFGNGRYVAVGDSPCTPDYGMVATS